MNKDSQGCSLRTILGSPLVLIIMKAIVVLSMKNLYHWEWNLTTYKANSILFELKVASCLKQTVN